MAVLLASIEADTALWEFPGEITGALGRHGISEAERSAARTALSLCVLDELIDTFRQDPAWTGELVLVPIDEALAIIADADFAIPSRTEVDFRFYITVRGVKAFSGLNAAARGDVPITWFTSTHDDARIVDPD